MGANRRVDAGPGTVAMSTDAPTPPVVPGVLFDVKIGDGGIADVWRGTWDDGSGPQTVKRLASVASLLPPCPPVG